MWPSNVHCLETKSEVFSLAIYIYTYIHAYMHFLFDKAGHTPGSCKGWCGPATE